MSYPINYPTPQGANIQIFREGGSTSNWVKPQGASFVWFTLIGAGFAGDSTGGTAGRSGAVTNFMGPAFLMPNILRVKVGLGGQTDGAGGTNSEILYQQKDGSGYQLLTAASASAMTANAFTSTGFFQSVAGVAAGGAITAPSTTFLTAGGTSGNGTSNYGYTTIGTSSNGYFQMQPIIVGIGGTNDGGNGGIGCGGGAFTGVGFGKGGDGLVVIITW